MFQENVFSSNNEHLLRSENSEIPPSFKKKKNSFKNSALRGEQLKDISLAPLFLIKGRAWAHVSIKCKVPPPPPFQYLCLWNAQAKLWLF